MSKQGNSHFRTINTSHTTKGMSMMKKDVTNNFDLKLYDTLEIYGKIVKVVTRKEVKYYSREGVLLGKCKTTELEDDTFTVLEDSILIKDTFLPKQSPVCNLHKLLKNHILDIPLEKDLPKRKLANYKFMSCTGKQLVNVPITSFKIFSKNDNKYVCLENDKGEHGIFTNTGECIIPFGTFEVEYQKTKKGFIVLNFFKYKKVYDLNVKEFLNGNYKDVEIFPGYYFLEKCNDKIKMYNTTKKIFEMEIDAYIEEWDDLLIYSQNRCGLVLLQKAKDEGKIFLPVKYNKIKKILAGEVIAYRNNKSERYNIFDEKWSNKEKLSEEKDAELEPEQPVKFNDNIVVYANESVIMLKNTILLVNRNTSSYSILNYNGIRIGPVCKLIEPKISIKDFIEIEDFIAIQTSHKKWQIFDYNGRNMFSGTVFKKKMLEFNLISLTEETDEDAKECKIIGIDTKNEKTLCMFTGFKSLRYIGEGFFYVYDFNEKLWVINSKGEKLIYRRFELDKIVFYKNLIFEKNVGYYMVFDSLRKTYTKLEVDDIILDIKSEVDEVKSYAWQNLVVFWVYKAEKIGLYAYSPNKGMVKYVPIEYINVYIEGKFIYAEKENGDDIYNVEGKLIATTLNEN